MGDSKGIGSLVAEYSDGDVRLLHPFIPSKMLLRPYADIVIHGPYNRQGASSTSLRANHA